MAMFDGDIPWICFRFPRESTARLTNRSLLWGLASYTSHQRVWEMISGKPSGREFTTTNKIQYTHVYPTIIIEKDLEKPWFHNDNNPQIVDFPHQTISLPQGTPW